VNDLLHHPQVAGVLDELDPLKPHVFLDVQFVEELHQLVLPGHVHLQDGL
jgi:hypothetical protein